HLRSRDDGPRAQPDDPLHHGTGTTGPSGPGGRRDRRPDLRAQLRHALGLLGRPSRWIPSREAHGSDVHLVEQRLPPLRRPASAHHGSPGTSPVPASDHRGLRAQSPGNPDVHVPRDLVRHVPSSPRGSRPQRPFHLAGPPPDAHGTGLLRGGHPARLRRPRPQPRGVRALSGVLHLARSDRSALATPGSEMRKIHRRAVLAAPTRRWGAAGGLRSPDLQFLRRGRLRLHIRNCRSAGLSYGGAGRPESCGGYQGYGTRNRWTWALSSTSRGPSETSNPKSVAGSHLPCPWHRAEASNGPPCRRWACAMRAITVPLPKTTRSTTQG